MKDEAMALLKVWSTVFLSLSYCYFIVSKIPKGKFRLFSLLPIFYLYTILPLFLSSVFPAGVTASFITWLTNFKLLMFSFNLGPLTTPIDPQNSRNRKGPGLGPDVPNLTLTRKGEYDDEYTGVRKGSHVRNRTLAKKGDYDDEYNGLRKSSHVRNLTIEREPIKSFPMFILMAAFPIKLIGPTIHNKKPNKVLPLNFWSKALVSSILLAICDKYREELHPGVVFVIYCCLLCFLVDIAMGISNMLVGPILGVELAEPSDEPYVATSLQDFWGKRWNLIVTDTLRHTVYKPTRVFLSNRLGERWALPLAIMAAFLVSALMHELIFFYVTRVRPSWEVTWFFVLQGLCVMVEVALKKGLGRKMRLHWAVTGPLTVGFVMGTGYLWFFPPLVRNQVDVRTIEEFMSLFEFIKGMFKRQL